MKLIAVISHGNLNAVLFIDVSCTPGAVYQNCYPIATERLGSLPAVIVPVLNTLAYLSSIPFGSGGNLDQSPPPAATVFRSELSPRGPRASRDRNAVWSLSVECRYSGRWRSSVCCPGSQTGRSLPKRATNHTHCTAAASILLERHQHTDSNTVYPNLFSVPCPLIRFFIYLYPLSPLPPPPIPQKSFFFNFLRLAK
jgi:hypothetical protein